MTITKENIKIIATPDEDTQLDHLGEYSTEPGPDERTINRQKKGDMTPGEYKYFISATEEYAEENYERMEAISRGEITFYGIRAVAEVPVKGTKQKIKSGGIWGVESDAGSTHAEEVAQEELRDLMNILGEIDIGTGESVEASWQENAPWSGKVQLNEDN